MKWKLDSHKHNITGTGWHLRDEDGCTVAIVLSTPEGELKPIADLIAAAPDLLEALEAIVSTRNAEARAIKSYDNARENFSQDGYEYHAMVNAMQKASDAEKLAKQAIAKAKG